MNEKRFAGKVVCVGRNYAEHAKELGNPVPQTPIFFIKPSSSVVAFDGAIQIQQKKGDHHYECEFALLIGETLSEATPAEVNSAIDAVGLGLDLTLRDLQSSLKEKGHPWEKSKAFDGACPLSVWLPLTRCSDAPSRIQWSQFSYSFSINGEQKQSACLDQMLFQIPELVSEMSQWFRLNPGDVVLTGTPKGVGVLKHQDQLSASILFNGDEVLNAQASVEEIQ